MANAEWDAVLVLISFAVHFPIKRLFVVAKNLGCNYSEVYLTEQEMAKMPHPDLMWVCEGMWESLKVCKSCIESARAWEKLWKFEKGLQQFIVNGIHL